MSLKYCFRVSGFRFRRNHHHDLDPVRVVHLGRSTRHAISGQGLNTIPPQGVGAVSLISEGSNSQWEIVFMVNTLPGEIGARRCTAAKFVREQLFFFHSLATNSTTQMLLSSNNQAFV